MGPGILALSCGDVGRYAASFASIHGLHRPEGSRYYQVQSISIAANFNSAVRVLLETSDAEWLFTMNDDHLYQPDTLLRLLAREVDVVTGLYVERVPPFAPVLFDHSDARRHHRRRLLRPGESGLIPIVACGDGCLLMRRHVLEAIPPPWWSFADVEPDGADHDMALCRRIRDAGFPIYADLDVRIGHIAALLVTPEQLPDGRWIASMATRGDYAIHVPVPQMMEEYADAIP